MAPFTKWRSGFAQKSKRELELENELTKAKMALEESERFKDNFLNNMSHEFCNPLNGILGFSQVMLKSEEISPKVKNDLKIILDNGKSLLTIANNILDVTKLDNGQIKLRKSPICLNTMLDRLHNQFLASPAYINKNANGRKNIEILCEKPYKNIAIMNDTERLRQILFNLLDNALKFTNSGTIRFGYTISINSLSKDRFLTFYVKDSGIGIPSDKTEKVMERFYQLDNTMSRRHNGAGLGLAITKGLVDLMKGRMWCDSEIGKGTSFYFSIPYSPAYVLKENELPTVNTELPRDWSGYTVLVVEDDIMSYRVLGGMLRNTKVTIIHSDNGVKAIEQVRINPQIDLVLMDVNMPVMNGLEATGKILEINPTIPIIAQTTNEKEKCLEAGCIDYISKPIDMSVLYSKMSKFLI